MMVYYVMRVIVIVVVLVVMLVVIGVDVMLRYGFYKYLCFNVESIIYKVMKVVYEKDNIVVFGVFCFIFYDCFVWVCM